MKLVRALTAGFAGSIALTVTHQFLHHHFNNAPRMDLMGEEGLMRLAAEVAIDIPRENIYGITLAGDIAGNALFFSLAAAGSKKNAVARGTILGLVAGVGGICLPKHIGLNNAYSNRTTTTKLMTAGIYTLGGMIAGYLAKKI